MIASSLSRFLIAFCAISSAALFCQTTSEDRTRAELDRSLRARIEAWFPNLCRGFESGRTFDIQDEQIQIEGNIAKVSYVLVVFESCEEGAPYQASRETETWVRRANGWKRVERCTGSNDRGNHKQHPAC